MIKLIEALHGVYKIIDKSGGNKIDSENGYFLFHQERYLSILDVVLKLSKSQKEIKILEIGSLFCHLPIALNILGYEACGIDLEIKHEIAERCKKYNITNKECNLLKDKIPFDNNYFDVVIFSETLEHLNFHPLRIFQEINRILKINGKVIITTPNLLRLNNRIKLLIGQSINYDLREEYSIATHFREYSSEEIKYLLQKGFFKNIKISYKDFNYPGANKAVFITNKIIGFIFSFLKSNIIAIGDKK